MLPLCGFTVNYQTYTAAIGFLSRGAEHWYDLTIAASLDLIGIDKTEIEVIFTDREDAVIDAIDTFLRCAERLSCRWYLQENIKLAAEPFFADLEGWKDKLSAYGNFQMADIANAGSGHALHQALATLRQRWDGGRYDGANGCIQTILDDTKELFIAAYIDHTSHLGQTSSPRLGAHRAFILYLHHA